MQMRRENEAGLQRALLMFTFSAVLLWTLLVVQWYFTGSLPTLLLIAYPIIAISGGVSFYIALPRTRRPFARKMLLMLVGSFLAGVAFASRRGNMQIEGLFFGLLTGLGLPVVLHYAIGKIFGPLVFGRIWCGWACWYSMVFDLLPYKSGDRHISARWGQLRYLHFGLSLLLVLGLWYVYDYRQAAQGETGQQWFLVGLMLYHLIGIVLALVLKDNRAFCKYLCPVAVPLKATARFSLLKVTGDPAACNCCEQRTCVTVCPMNVRIPDYVAQGKRVLSTECILCQECINTCPDEALKLSFGLDVGGEELLDVRAPAPAASGR
jgi:polyferredoxin